MAGGGCLAQGKATAEGPAPQKKLTKLPAKLGTNVMESTPPVTKGRRLMFHSRRVDVPKPNLDQMHLWIADHQTGEGSCAWRAARLEGIHHYRASTVGYSL